MDVQLCGEDRYAIVYVNGFDYGQTTIIQGQPVSVVLLRQTTDAERKAIIRAVHARVGECEVKLIDPPPPPPGRESATPEETQTIRSRLRQMVGL